MGGREPRREYPEREQWITEVSSSRLARYERLMESSAAPRRLTGERRIGDGDYFRDLVRREVERRNRE